MTPSNVLPFEPPPAPIRHTRTGFENIPRDLSKAELLRYFTYSPEDRHEIFQCRGNSNKVGFALLLSGVRLTGRFPTNFELIGSSLLAHVCAQLSVEGMLFLDYPQRLRDKEQGKNIAAFLAFILICALLIYVFTGSRRPTPDDEPVAPHDARPIPYQ